MARTHSVVRNVVWNHASKILDFGLLYLVRVIVARTLGPANDSLFALFSNLTTVLVLVSALGTDWLVYRFAPGYASRGDRDALASLLRTTYLLRLAASVVCALALVAVLHGVAGDSRWSGLATVSVMAGVFIVGQNLTMLGTAAFTAMMNTRTVFSVTVSTRVLLAASVAFVASRGALTAGGAVSLIACGVAVSAAIYAFTLRPHFRGVRVPLPVRAMAAFSGVLLTHDLLWLVLGRQSDILVLSYWFPHDPQISWYDNAFQIGLVVEQAVTVGLAGVLFSAYARMAAEDRNGMGEAHHRVLQGIQLAFIPVAATVALVAPGVITAFYGPQYLPAAQLVQVFVLLDVIDTGLFGGGANVVLLNTVGREKTVLYNRVSWGALNLAVNLYVIPRYGALPALAVSRACNLAAVFTEYRIVVAAVGGAYSLRNAATALGAAAVGTLIAVWVPRESLAGCVAAAMIMAAVVSVVYALVKPPAMRWVIDALRRSLHGAGPATSVPSA